MSKHGFSVVTNESKPEAAEVKPQHEQATLKAPKRQGLLYDRTVDKFLILLLPVTWFVYYSWRPIYRLRRDMPPQFVDVPATAKPAEHAREERLARQYWNLARAVRWKFTNGSPLPVEPPLEFRIDTQGAAGSLSTAAGQSSAPSSRTRAEVPDSRTRYWRKLQVAWLQPDSWDAHREWSTAWFTGPCLRLYIDFQDYMQNLVRTN